MKYESAEWDFANNRYAYTHPIHNYPAKLVPEIVEKLLYKYKTDDMKYLFEPYVGSGTTIVEANIKGLNCVCTDLNALARKITKVKTTFINIKKLDEEIKNFQCNGDLFNKELHIDEFDFSYPNRVTNIKFWFKQENIKELIPIYEYIKQINDENIKDFFEIAFSQTLREVSLTRNSEFKRYKMSPDKINGHRLQAYSKMIEKLILNQKSLKAFMEVGNKDKKIEIYSFNTVNEIPESLINKIDIIITSPPYGDSSSTVAYGQFSRFANEWLGYDNDSGKLDSKLMGGKKSQKIYFFDFPLIDDSLKKIELIDPKRALDISSFYEDYKKSICNVAKTIKKNGIVAYIVGNRTVKGEFLETDEFTRHFFEVNGFKHEETIIRNITKKRLPQSIAPTGKNGITVKTMNQEYIVVMRKL